MFWLVVLLTGSGNRSPCACSLTFSLRIVAGRIVEFYIVLQYGVGDVGVAEQEERVDKTLDDERHDICRISLDLVPFFVRCGS